MPGARMSFAIVLSSELSTKPDYSRRGIPHPGPVIITGRSVGMAPRLLRLLKGFRYTRWIVLCLTWSIRWPRYAPTSDCCVGVTQGPKHLHAGHRFALGLDTATDVASPDKTRARRRWISQALAEDPVGRIAFQAFM